MSRVSSWKTKHECISAFFEKYPTPTAFAEESKPANVLAAIKSLGLFDDRLRSLVALTDTFLRGAPLEPSKKKSPRADEFKVETDRKSVHKVHGVGPFGVESWLVFCKDQGATIKLSKGGEPLAPFGFAAVRPDTRIAAAVARHGARPGVVRTPACSAVTQGASSSGRQTGRSNRISKKKGKD